jgi:putative transposase
MTILAWLRPRQDLVLENLLLRHQLAVLTRPTRSRPQTRLRTWDKLLWVLARRRCAGWRGHLAIVTPETVVRWHRQAWRLFWRRKSRSQGGRPHLSLKVWELIATISRGNRLWGTERIRGELLKLGIVVSNRSIRRYRWRAPQRPSSQTWRTFLRKRDRQPDGWVSTASSRPFGHLVRMQSSRESSGHFGANVWTTSLRWTSGT